MSLIDVRLSALAKAGISIARTKSGQYIIRISSTSEDLAFENDVETAVVTAERLLRERTIKRLGILYLDAGPITAEIAGNKVNGRLLEQICNSILPQQFIQWPDGFRALADLNWYSRED